MWLTEAGIDRTRSAAGSAASSSDGHGWRSRKGSPRGRSGFLDPMICRVEFLRRCYGGQDGPRATGGEKSRRCSDSPAAMRGHDSGDVEA